MTRYSELSSKVSDVIDYRVLNISPLKFPLGKLLILAKIGNGHHT